MKNITLSLALFITFLSNGQEKFTYDEDGLNPKYLVGEAESKTQQEIYKKSINWIKETYQNPDEVIKTTIENKKIRFEAVEVDLMSHSSLGSRHFYNTTYTIEIEFREGKYKFEALSISYRVPPSRYNLEKTISIDFTNGEEYYRRGKLKSRTRTIPKAVEDLLNDLSNSLNEYVVKEESTKEW